MSSDTMSIKRVNPVLDTVLCGRTSVPLLRCEYCRRCLNIETDDDDGNTYVFCEDEPV